MENDYYNWEPTWEPNLTMWEYDQIEVTTLEDKERQFIDGLYFKEEKTHAQRVYEEHLEAYEQKKREMEARLRLLKEEETEERKELDATTDQPVTLDLTKRRDK